VVLVLEIGQANTKAFIYIADSGNSMADGRPVKQDGEGRRKAIDVSK
jgi:hypothetical protein